MEKVLERFISYARVDTQSDENSESCPSTKKQLVLARMLEKEMKAMGLDEVSLDDNGYLMASLPSNTEKQLPVLGLIAHVDTSPDMSGKNVQPSLIKDYDGKDIILNSKKNIILSPAEFPGLLKYKGCDLVTGDGNTLLGSDDKAGIAEILSAVEYFLENPDVKHGKVRIGFTPDEEIGRGADKFDVEAFGADFAFTIDGGEEGELEYENFNAAMAVIEISGRNVHPGTAKNQMINSIHLAHEFNAMLPEQSRPEHTTAYEGFFHLTDITGDVEKSRFRYLIRDHDRNAFEQKKKLVKSVAVFLNKKYGRNLVRVKIKDQYYNMRDKISDHFHIVELAEKAMKEAGVEPLIRPIRGGTDGARLSYMGLPCPNIFTGGQNFHGRYEYIPVRSMQNAVKTIINVIKLIPGLY
ncbi:MAG: peptidase T [Bacteroidales bacterium]|jgi:tripeptide aminopeptidase|nr:peptidase T [Bacteroidales bacterium]